MPSESDRPIEKLMRDYAADRKSAAKPGEFELHSITRNALKVEVVKVYGRHLPGENRPTVRTPFWPKLAWAGGGIFALALLIVFVLPTGPAGETDQLSLAKIDETTMRPANGGTFQFYAVKTVAPVAATVPPVEQDKVNAADAKRSFNTAQPKPADAIDKPVAATSLLSSFEFRVNGDEVIVIDRDRSRYVGRIRSVAAGETRTTKVISGVSYLDGRYDPRFLERYGLVTILTDGGGPAAGRFTVTGTNLTTRQPVEFAGRLVTWTQAVSPEGSSAASPPTVLQIEGTATLGGQPAVSIDATTTPQY